MYVTLITFCSRMYIHVQVNHFPGTFQIGRKDRLWRNLSKMQVHFGKKEFSFFPQTFVLPVDMKQFKRVWEDGGNKQKWIIKPVSRLVASMRGGSGGGERVMCSVSRKIADGDL